MDMSLINSDCNQILADAILRHASHNEIALLVFSFFSGFSCVLFLATSSFSFSLSFCYHWIVTLVC